MKKGDIYSTYVDGIPAGPGVLIEQLSEGINFSFWHVRLLGMPGMVVKVSVNKNDFIMSGSPKIERFH